MSALRWQRKTPQLLRFPGEDAWETWLGNTGQLWQRTETPAQTTGGVTAIETLALDSAPFWSLTHAGADDASAAVALRWESLGIVGESSATPWAHWTVSQTAKRVLIATVAVTGESALAGWRRQAPECFEPSARLLPLPADAVCVWTSAHRVYGRGWKIRSSNLKSSLKNKTGRALNVPMLLKPYRFTPIVKTKSCNTRRLASIPNEKLEVPVDWYM